MKEITATLAQIMMKNFLRHSYGEYEGHNENPSLQQLFELKGALDAAIVVKLSGESCE